MTVPAASAGSQGREYLRKPRVAFPDSRFFNCIRGCPRQPPTPHAQEWRKPYDSATRARTSTELEPLISDARLARPWLRMFGYRWGMTGGVVAYRSFDF